MALEGALVFFGRLPRREHQGDATMVVVFVLELAIGLAFCVGVWRLNWWGVVGLIARAGLIFGLRLAALGSSGVRGALFGLAVTIIPLIPAFAYLWLFGWSWRRRSEGAA